MATTIFSFDLKGHPAHPTLHPTLGVLGVDWSGRGEGTRPGLGAWQDFFGAWQDFYLAGVKSCHAGRIFGYPAKRNPATPPGEPENLARGVVGFLFRCGRKKSCHASASQTGSILALSPAWLRPPTAKKILPRPPAGRHGEKTIQPRPRPADATEKKSCHAFR